MRILYGVVGEGMGHATRSRVVIEHLLDQGHELLVVVSGRAHAFLADVLAQAAVRAPGAVEVREIAGLHLIYDEDGVDRSESVWSNVAAAPASLRTNVGLYAEVVGRFTPDAVISDFESWAYLFARVRDIPVVSIDNMQVLNRCAHPAAMKRTETGRRDADWTVAKWSVKVKLPGAWHYIVSSFFFPPVRKPRTTLVPPILRPQILAAKRERGEHVLVYQTAANNQPLLALLSALPHRFLVYGMGTERSPDLGANVELRPFSQDGFIDDLRTARAVVAGGGYSLMGEAVHLGVPMLALPLASQYEQMLNARYLTELGYGDWAPELTEEALNAFLSALDGYEAALATYPRQGNAMLLGCVDEVLRRIGLGEPRRDALDAPSMGDRVSSKIDAALEE